MSAATAFEPAGPELVYGTVDWKPAEDGRLTDVFTFLRVARIDRRPFDSKEDEDGHEHRGLDLPEQAAEASLAALMRTWRRLACAACRFACAFARSAFADATCACLTGIVCFASVSA